MRFLDLLLVDNSGALSLDGIKVRALVDQRNNASTDETTEEVISQLFAEATDLVILDVFSPVSEAKTHEHVMPHERLNVAFLSLDTQTGAVSQIKKFEITGYVFKDLPKGDLLYSLKSLGNGSHKKRTANKMFSNGHYHQKSQHSHHVEKLTTREKEILQLIVEEYTTDEIAQRLYISKTTVNSHRKNLLRKLDAKNVVGLVKAVYEQNIFE